MAFKQYRSEPLTEKEKAFRRRSLGIKQRFAADAPKSDAVKERDYYAPVKEGFVPAKPRGRSCCRISPEVRAMVEGRKASRRAFFASLGVRV